MTSKQVSAIMAENAISSNEDKVIRQIKEVIYQWLLDTEDINKLNQVFDLVIFTK